MVLRGGAVVTLDPRRRIIEDGVVAITDGVITEVAARGEESTLDAVEIVDTGGCAVLPGFVNAHTHSVFTLTRGREPELPLDEWLPYVFAEAEVIGPIEAGAGAALGYLEMLERGITTCIDHHYAQADPENVDAVVEAAAASGMRVMLAPTASDIGAFSMTDAEAVASYERLVEVIGDSRTVVPWTSLASPVRRETPARCRLVRSLAREMQTGLTFHYAESKAWLDLPTEVGAANLVEVLETLDLLGPDVVIAHGVWFDESDLDLLATTGTTVSYNPVSNMYLGDGIAPVAAMLRAGVPIALGTDAANCNNRCDPFESMKTGALLQKVHHHDPRVLSAERALELATSGGAAAVGLGDRAGVIEVGRAADVVVVDMDRPHLTPCHDLVSNLVYCATGDDVATVVVDGRVVVRDGQAVGVDRERVLDGARSAAARLDDQLA